MLWGDGDSIRNPEGSTYPEKNQIQTTVADQIADENSLYNYYCRLISIRHKYPAIARGIYTVVKGGSKNLGGFVIEYEGENWCLLHNNGQAEVTFDLAKLEGYSFDALCDFVGVSNAKLEGTVLTVGPQTSVIIK